MITDFDTIAAISTPPGEGGIGIVRISGEDAVEVAERVYRFGKKKLSEQDSHTIHFGYIYEPDTGERIDEVMTSVMRAPKTYTREDVVEINTHGGMLATNRALEAVLASGARMAEPGEFTKRAFINGRVDLSQAEAVMDIIRSKTDESMQMAMNQLDGALSDKITAIRDKILQTLAQVEVNIDYPEYDEAEEMTAQYMLDRTEEAKEEVEDLLASSRQGKILRDGLSTAIIGKPNVGKSSLLNALLSEERAIVTDIAGTTRDVVEDYLSIQGVPIRLIDTAGIRETEDEVEKIGVERSRQAIGDADLVLLVLNQNEPLTQEDKELIEATRNKTRIIILNKSDLDSQINKEELQKEVGNATMIETSILERNGLGELEDEIVDLFFSGQTKERDANYVSNNRHINLLRSAKQSLDDVVGGLEAGMPIDLVQIDLTSAWETLGEITGETVQDELLNKLFSEFCLGK